jgi:hypothetical protein
LVGCRTRFALAAEDEEGPSDCRKAQPPARGGNVAGTTEVIPKKGGEVEGVEIVK